MITNLQSKPYILRCTLLLLLMIGFVASYAQNGSVGIGTPAPHPSAILEIKSDTKGLLVPRMHIADTTNRAPIAVTPAEGLTVFNNAYNPGDVTSGMGYYYWTNARGGRWVPLSGNASLAKDTITGDTYITVTGGDGAVLQKVGIKIEVDKLADTLTNAKYFVDSLLQMFRDSVTTWYNNNPILQDSIYNTIKSRSDSLSGDSYINVQGGDSSVLSRVYLSMNLLNLSDTLTNARYFIDSLVTNNSFRDSVKNIVTQNTTIDNHIVKVIQDSVTIHQGLGDSVFMAVKDRADSITSKNHIMINGGNSQDSAVLNRVDLDLDLVGLAHDTLFNHTLAHDTSFINALGNDSMFITTVTTNNQFHDSLVRILTQDTTINSSIVKVIQDSVTIHQGLGDSVFMAVKDRADSITSKNHIIINGGNSQDSAVLNRVDLDLDLVGLAHDTLFNHTLAHDTSFINALGNDSMFITTVTTNNQFHDSLVRILTQDTTINSSIVKVIQDSVTIHQGLGDSVFMAVKDRADSITSKNHIIINGGNSQDSAVLNRVDLDLDLVGLAHDTLFNKTLARDTSFTHTLGNDSTFITTVTSNSQFRDSITTMVYGNSDTLTGDTYIQVTGGDSAVLQRASLNLNIHAVSDSVRRVTRALSANIRIVVDAATAVNDSDYTIIMRKLTADRTLTLPAASASKGRVLVINQFNSYNFATQTPVYVKFVDGSSNPVKVIYADMEDPVTPGAIIDAEYDYIAGMLFGGSTGGSMKITLQSDGLRWYVVSFTM